MKKNDTSWIMPKPINLNTIQKEIPFIARCLKADPMDAHIGTPEDKRWMKGDEMTVVKIESTVLGTFLYDAEGHNMDIRRAGLIQIGMDDLSPWQQKKHTEIMNWIEEHYPNCKNETIEEQDRIGREAYKAIVG